MRQIIIHPYVKINDPRLFEALLTYSWNSLIRTIASKVRGEK